MDLVGDETFNDDLKAFFQGGRYNYTQEEMDELGPAQLANDFAEHMRFQSLNEATAAKDLLYVLRDYGTDPSMSNPEQKGRQFTPQYPGDVPKRYEDVEMADGTIQKRYISDYDETRGRDERYALGQQAFGRLITAFDNSPEVGTSAMETGGDYLRAFVTSPSTIFTAATFGFGVGTKAAAVLASKGTQVAIRATIAQQMRSNVAHKIIKDGLQKKLFKSAVVAGGQSFLMEGALGAASSLARNETRRQVVEGYEYGPADVVKDTMIDGTVGASIGSLFGLMGARSNNKMSEMIFDQVRNGEKLRRASLKTANATIKAADPTVLNNTIDDVVEIFGMLQAKQKGNKLDPLDPEFVAQGDAIRSLLLTGKPNKYVASTLSVETVRGIAAASLDMKKALKLKPNQRITAAIAEAIEGGNLITPDIVAIKKKYNLSNEQFSYIFLSDLSRAGKVLQTGSMISKALTNIEVLAQEGISSISGLDAAEVFTDVGGEVTAALTKSRRSKTAEALGQVDSLRIAFMTSQLGTTSANVGTGAFNTLVDISDNFWKNTIRVTKGEVMPDGTVKRRWIGGTLSTLRGMSLNRAEAGVVKDLMLDESPLAFRELFYETVKGMDVSGSNSLLPKIGRILNTLNIATDSVFKEAALYSGLDRKLRELNDPNLGSNLQEFLTRTKPDGSNMKLSDLPEGVMDYAIDAAQRFTFQKGFKKDKSLFGHGARGLQSMHHKVPFLVSVGMDTPFPRYIANHLEYAHDYSGIGIITGGIEKLDELVGGLSNTRTTTLVGGDVHKTMLDRTSRTLTGAMLTMGGYGLAVEKEGKVDFDKLVATTKTEVDISRMAGPWAINLLLGDLIYRYRYGLPMNKTVNKENLLEILGGVPDLSSGAYELESKLIANIFKSMEAGTATPQLEKNLGDIVATFTYPATFARDLAGQMNYDSAGNPYTRDLFPSKTAGERSMLDDIAYSNLLKNQATRFLTDTSMFSYTQSWSSGKSEGFDYKLYTPFNQNPVGSWNPMTKSFGAIEEPPSSLIQQEMTLLNLQDYKMYGDKQVPNPSVQYQTSYMLSQKIPYLFKAWKTSYPLDGETYGGRTYDELGNDYEKKRNALEGFINQTVRDHSKAVTSMFDDVLQNPESKKKAIGYVRNQYELQGAIFHRAYGSLDKIVQFYSGQFEGAKSSKEYIENAGSIVDEINRRQRIMAFIPKYDFKKDMKLGTTRQMYD